MIKIENIEIPMTVMTKRGIGNIVDLWLSDANRVYAIVNLQSGETYSTPIDLISKLR